MALNTITSKLSSDEKLRESGDAVHFEIIPPDEDGDSIEQTDTGKATWLIAATVSLGGFLFGTVTPFSSALSYANCMGRERCECALLTSEQVTIPV